MKWQIGIVKVHLHFPCAIFWQIQVLTDPEQLNQKSVFGINDKVFFSDHLMYYHNT